MNSPKRIAKGAITMKKVLILFLAMTMVLMSFGAMAED